MTNHREILRLNSRGISQRSIAVSCQCSRNTVADVLRRAKEVNLKWPLPSDMSDGDLGDLLFPQKAEDRPARRTPDLDYIHKEMLKAGVNLRLLWVEYCTACRLANESPLMYSQYCYYYQK